MNSRKFKPKQPLGKLEAYLKTQFGSAFKDLSVREFSGGASNPTFLLDSSQGNYVLRSKPIGKLVNKAHAIDREYRIMNALGTTDFPVPKTYFYCDDTDIMGAEFYVMKHIEGQVFEDFTLPGLNASERAAIYDSMNETIAQLHNIDPNTIGLSNYGKQGNYFERQISLWLRQYKNQDQNIPEFENLAEWLSTNLVTDERRTIVHGDYRLANIIISPNSPEVAAVLDWELSTLGHPLADFTYNLSQWYMPNFSKDFGVASLVNADLEELGIPSMEHYAESYSKRTGMNISQKDLYYSIAFNMYRFSGIIIGVLGRIKAGTSKKDIAKSTADSLKPTIELAWHYANKADAS